MFIDVSISLDTGRIACASRMQYLDMYQEIPMHIVLTQPQPAFMRDVPFIPDIGVGSLASSLKARGHEATVLDWNMPRDVAWYRRRLQELAPEVVGLKFFTKDAKAAQQTLALIKEVVPKAVILAGGPHPSCEAPEQLLRDFPAIDFAFRGEAEHTLPSFLDGLADGAPPLETPGLVWREGDTVRANARELPTDLDALPMPDWEQLDPATYLPPRPMPGFFPGPHVPIATTRGCPAQCTFCSASLVNGRVIRTRSAANVVEEMAYLHDVHGVKNFMITDNCFTSHRDRLLGVCEGILSRGLDIAWDCNCYERLDNLDATTVPLMARAGLKTMLMGIESAAASTRKTMRKHVDFQAYKDKAALLKRHGVPTLGFFMLGFPGETREAMRETVREALGMGAQATVFNAVYPLPGSAIYDSLKAKHGVDSLDWTAYAPETTSFAMSDVPSNDVARMLRLARMGAKVSVRSPVLGKAFARLFFG